MAEPNDPNRVRMRQTIAAACSNHPTWTTMEPARGETLVRRMERSCFAATVESCTRDGIDRLWIEKKFVNRYSAECGRIISNLDIKSSVNSTYLIDQLIAGAIDPNKIASYTSWDLCPAASQVERDEIAQRQSVKVEKKVSRAHKCGKCGKNETTVERFQGCAADEGDTASIKCINCGHVWRRKS